jgi:hypothetical protein
LRQAGWLGDGETPAKFAERVVVEGPWEEWRMRFADRTDRTVLGEDRYFPAVAIATFEMLTGQKMALQPADPLGALANLQHFLSRESGLSEEVRAREWERVLGMLHRGLGGSPLLNRAAGIAARKLGARRVSAKEALSAMYLAIRRSGGRQAVAGVRPDGETIPGGRTLSGARVVEQELGLRRVARKRERTRAYGSEEGESPEPLAEPGVNEAAAEQEEALAALQAALAARRARPPRGRGRRAVLERMEDLAAGTLTFTALAQERGLDESTLREAFDVELAGLRRTLGALPPG